MFKKKNIYSARERFKKDISRSPSWGWYSILAIWLTMFILIIGAKPTKATSEFEFGSYLQSVQVEYADLYRLQKSIRICEGYDHKESLAWKNRNPGNLKAGGLTDKQGHTIFNSQTEGYLAHLELLYNRYWGMNPYEMNHLLHYASDPNWHECVSWYYNGF